MDNNAFEKEMINAVNGNADASREAKFAEDAQKWIERRKARRVRSVTEIVCWVLGFIVIGFAFGIASRNLMVDGGLAVGIASVFGLVAGVRVGNLVRTI